VGSKDDSYDNALAETIIGLYKTESIHRRGHGKHANWWNSPRWNGCRGSTTFAFSSPLALSQPQKQRQ
jgi:hypothetical protein